MPGEIPVQVSWEKVQQLTVYNVETGNRMNLTFEGEELDLLAYLPQIIQKIVDEHGTSG